MVYMLTLGGILMVNVTIYSIHGSYGSSFSDQYSSHKSSIDAIWNRGVTQQPVSNDGDAKTFSAAVMGPLDPLG